MGFIAFIMFGLPGTILVLWLLHLPFVICYEKREKKKRDADLEVEAEQTRKRIAELARKYNDMLTSSLHDERLDVLREKESLEERLNEIERMIG